MTRTDNRRTSRRMAFEKSISLMHGIVWVQRVGSSTIILSGLTSACITPTQPTHKMFSSDQDLLLNVGSEVCTSRTSGMKESESTQQIERNVPQCVCSQQRGNMFMHCWIQTLVTETAMQERPLFLSCMQESNCACDPESSRVVSQHLV